MGDFRVGVVGSGKPLQLRPAAALLTGAVPASAQQQKVSLHTKGQAVGLGAQIHPIQSGGAFQGNHIRALLILLEKISACQAEKGKVGGCNDIFRLYPPMVRESGGSGQSAYRCVFKNGQVLGNGVEKLDGVKPGLVGEPDAAGGGHGQGKARDQLRRVTQHLQSGQLPLQNGGIRERIYNVVLPLKITVKGGGQIAQRLQTHPVGLQIALGPGFALGLQKGMINQAMLGGDFGAGSAGGAAGNGRGLRHHAGQTCLLQGPGAQDARHTGADDQYVRFCLPPERGKIGQMAGVHPQRFHAINSFCP